MNINKDCIFDEKQLLELPLYYRYFTQLETKNVKELYLDYRFSRSIKHFSNNYINSDSYKPISGILFQELLKKETQK